MCRLQGILSILSFWWVTGCLSESGQNKDCGEEIHTWKQFFLAELLFGNTEAYFHLIIYRKEKHSLHWIQLRNLNPLQTWLTAHESKRGLYGFMMTLIIALTHSSAANLLGWKYRQTFPVVGSSFRVWCTCSLTACHKSYLLSWSDGWAQLCNCLLFLMAESGSHWCVSTWTESQTACQLF